jgi:hypothetical protein
MWPLQLGLQSGLGRDWDQDVAVSLGRGVLDVLDVHQ